MRPKLLLFIATVCAIVLSEGCKKGEEDPFLSFRSRNARLIGTWKLDSREKSEIINIVTNTYNNINSESTALTEITTTSDNFNGTTRTDINKTSSNKTSYIMVFNSSQNKFIKDTITQMDVDGYIKNYNYSIEIKIEKNNSYTANFSESLLSHASYYINNGSEDTIFSPEIPPLDIKIWTVQDNWYWGNSKKKKILIVTEEGPMNGNLLRLSNKELIIEEEWVKTTTENDQTETNILT